MKIATYLGNESGQPLTDSVSMVASRTGMSMNATKRIEQGHG